MENPVYKCRVFTDCKRESPQTPSNNYNKFLNQKTEKGKKIANESEKSKKNFPDLSFTNEQEYPDYQGLIRDLKKKSLRQMK